MGKVNVVKMLILPKLIYKVNSSPVKISAGYDYYYYYYFWIN